MLKNCKYLLGLFVGLFGFTCFSNAGIVISPNLINEPVQYNGIINMNSGDCIIFMETDGYCGNHGQLLNNNNEVIYEFSNNMNSLFCINEDGYYKDTNYYSPYCYVTKFNNLFVNNCPSCPECEQCPEIDTGSILSGSCDINYCVENGLCPTGTGSRSELVINDIVHEGKPLININIPDYIQWDYAVDENQYDIYVGSGYDQDYIDSVLKINSYRPDNKDFTQIFVSGLTLIFPYIFVALLIVFIWKLLKRVFK